MFAAWEGSIHSWSFIDFAKLLIIILAICAVVYVATRAMGIQIPQWFIQIVLIVVVAAVAIFAITFLASM